MNTRDKLRHAPRALYAYERRAEEMRKTKREEAICGLLIFATVLAWAALVPVLSYLEVLP
ncbi:MAG TPA: hypothetical protein VLH12_12320 [Usitatibacter sp.]|nr:hypothetical protein [Usitatibacter sp.]